ncbi:phage tail protein [Shewanella basaltis]|uniref:phage tail-collar fiber domain-containing protein n=1 Tax=Shewanella basaltis TaxID=472183 RepID=UPI003AAC6454
MAQVITIAGERLFALKAQNNEQLDIDTFIFANVPGQDPNATIDRNEGLPPVAQRVHQQIVQQVGRINDNVVVYSTVLDSVTGPFDFNWVGLYSSANQTLIAVSHIPSVSKTITVPGAAGNTLNRNFGIEYSGIADLAGITVQPETWQLDFTARLSGMDELTRQLAADMNGKDWFIGDGFKVVPRSTTNTFKVTPGAGYVSGLRVELKQDHILTIQSYPQFVYVDAWFDGDASSKWAPKTAFTVTNGEMDDYIDVNGKPHYVVKAARIVDATTVEDLRSTKGLAQKIDEHLSKNEAHQATAIKLSTPSKRSVQDAFDEIPNILDFGASTNGVTSSRQAILDARAASKYRSQIYIPAGVYVCDEDIQQVYYGGGEVKKSNGQYNKKFIRAAQGITQATTVPMTCILRQDSKKSGWYFISDSGHRTNGFTSVAQQVDDPYSLQVEYDFTALKIGSITACTDEWFAKAGLKVGTSVSQSFVRIFAYKDACFSVANSTGVVDANGFFGETITAVLNQDKTVTVTHPPTLSATEKPVLSPWRPSPASILIPVLLNLTSTSFTYALYGNADGSINKIGNDWLVETTSSIKPTVVADTGGITITHPGMSSGITMVSARDGWGNAYVESTSNITTRVILRNYDGTLIDPTSENVNYKMLYNSNELVQQDFVFGGITCIRQNVALKWENVYGESGNLWVSGTMEV